MKIGQIVRSRNLDDHQGHQRQKLAMAKNKVAVLIYLGEEPFDGSEPLDIQERLRSLEWYQEST